MKTVATVRRIQYKLSYTDNICDKLSINTENISVIFCDLLL